MSKVIKHDTKLLIDFEFIERLEQAVEDGTISIRQHKEWYSRMCEKLLPRKIHFHGVRVDRNSTYLAWYFMEEDLADVDYFDLTVFRKLGYKIIEPEQTDIDLCRCPDVYLSAKELVHKYLILQNPGHVPIWYPAIMEMIENAMSKNGIVFYKP